ALLRRLLPSRKAGLSGDFVKDSAWLQRTTRDLLAANGLQDGQVLKSFNQEREMDGIRWLEDTLEMDYPAGFNSARFLKQLGSVLPKKGYRLVRNDKTDKKWILELGASEDVVFQKLVFHI
ncbi:MAG TPA: hypothetical protein P5079_08480, partial [Elusimicrobiota bacterium]|nr:hypothetical protein [Elusimicrobiota bacterium]